MSVTAGVGTGRIENSQCAITGVTLSTGGNNVTLNLNVIFKSFAGDRVFWVAAVNNSQVSSGWQPLGTVTVPSSSSGPLQDFVTCAGVAGVGDTCVLPASAFTVTNTNQIVLARSNVTISGSGSGANRTKLFRDSSNTDPLIVVDAPSPLSGVRIQNLTICGNSRLSQLTGPCTRTSTTCEYMTTNYTLPGSSTCVDISVSNVSTGLTVANPFTSPGPYALEIANVDMEDAAGHALGLYASSITGKQVNDVYIHDSQFNYSAVTGILHGANGVDYDWKDCDQWATTHGIPFADDPSVYATRNLRIENNGFTGNLTGAMGGGPYRWAAFRNNHFNGNYVNPQVGNQIGGTIQLDHCADTVLITGSKNMDFVGPAYSAIHPDTSALEIYGRNMTVSNLEITNYPSGGIGGGSLYNATITNNYIHGNSLNPYYSSPGVPLSTAFAAGPCDALPRDTQSVTMTNNNISGQPYGIRFMDDIGLISRHTLHGITIDGTNTISTTAAVPQVATDQPRVVLLQSNISSLLTQGNGHVASPPTRPLALPVDTPIGQLRCSSTPVNETVFTFEALDGSGVGNIQLIEGVFDLQGADDTGAGGPGSGANAVGAQGCHFLYTQFNGAGQVQDMVYLDRPQGGSVWAQSTQVGPGGVEINNGYCTIHGYQSSVVRETKILNLRLSVTFPTSASSTLIKHIYEQTTNNQGTASVGSNGPWTYWGTWKTN